MGDDRAQGACNVVAPRPATNREFPRALAAVLRRPAFAPAAIPGGAYSRRKTSSRNWMGSASSKSNDPSTIVLVIAFQRWHGSESAR